MNNVDVGVIGYHCSNGPAVVYATTNEWWYCGKMYSFEGWCRAANISDSERDRLLSIYGVNK